MRALRVGGRTNLLHRGMSLLNIKAGVSIFLGLGLAFLLSGCAAPLNPIGNRESGSLVTPIVSSPEPVESLDEESSCVQFVFEPERSAILGEAMADPQLQAVRQQLEARGLTLQSDQARIFQIAGAQVSLILPFGENAGLIWNRGGGSTSALGLIHQGQKTLNVMANGEEKLVRPLNQMQVRKMLRQLRDKPKFQAFEERLRSLGHQLDDVRVRAAIDETGHRLLLGLAVQDEQGEALSYALVIQAQPDGPDWTLTEDKEPQASLCAQAQSTGLSGVESPSTVVAQTGSGSGSGYYSGDDMCYLIEDPYLAAQCYRHLAPQLSVIPTILSYGQMVVKQSKDISFTVYNSGGTTLTGSVGGVGICTIVSGGSFSLAAGWHQSVTVRCIPTATGLFSLTLPVNSNGGNRTVTASGTAVLGPKLQVTPTSLNFGTVALGGTNDLSLTVKNIGDGALIGSLTATAPYSIVSGGSFNLTAGASQVVIVRFSPTVAGNFTTSLSVSSNGGNATISVMGVRQSWEEWYTQQVESGQVAENMLEAYNTAVSLGAGAVFVTTHKLSGVVSLYTGFPELEPEDVREFMDYANLLVQQSSGSSVGNSTPAVDEELLMQGLQAIGEDQLRSWLETLAQAFEDGMFDEVYAQLLSQGMSQLESLILQAIHSTNPEDAKRVLQSIAELILQASDGAGATGIEHLVQAQDDALDDLLGVPFEVLRGVACQVSAELALANNGVLADALGYQLYWGLKEAIGFFTNFRLWTGKSAKDMADFNCRLAEIQWNFNRQALNDTLDTETINQFISMLNKLHEALSSNNVAEYDKIMEILQTAWFASKHGWQLKGFDIQLPDVGPDQHVDLVLFKQDPNLANGKPVVSFLKIDDSDQVNPDKVLSWIDVALDNIDEAMQRTGAEIGTLTYAFKKPQTNTDMINLIQQLQTQFGDTSNPIVVAWVDDDEIPHVVCVGCNDDFTLEDAKNQACQQKGICVDQAEDAEDFSGQDQSSQAGDDGAAVGPAEVGGGVYFTE